MADTITKRILDFIYGANRPPSVSTRELQAKLTEGAEEANRLAEEAQRLTRAPKQ